MNSKCLHNRRKSICKGTQIYKHNRRKSNCKECHGSNICQHNRRKDMYYECGYKPKNVFIIKKDQSVLSVK